MTVYHTPPRAPGDSGVTVTDPYNLLDGDQLYIGAATSLTMEGRADPTSAVTMTSNGLISITQWSNIRGNLGDAVYATGDNNTINLEYKAYISGHGTAVRFLGTGNTFNLASYSSIYGGSTSTSIISGGNTTFNLAANAFLGTNNETRHLFPNIVKLTSGGNTFNIEKLAGINGGSSAIVIDGAGNLFNNKGQIKAEFGTTITLNSNDGGINTINNEGDILRHVDLAIKSGFFVDPNNRKVIESKGNAVDIIHNGVASGSTATIKGDIYLHDGDDVFYNYATGVVIGVDPNRSVLDMGAGNDVVYNSGRIANVVLLGDGDDRYDSSDSIHDDIAEGGMGSDEMIGGAGDNSFFGGAGVDYLYGGAGNDYLVGGTGNDILEGGSGQDAFVFDNTASIDTIADFTVGQDFILLDKSEPLDRVKVFDNLSSKGALSEASFTIGTEATSADHRIIYDDKSGKLFYDADGTGAAEAVQFARLSKYLDLNASSFIVI